ncbi:RagB/SusD family nutrient uptake outer membrane protein [Sphingobacterium kitahiroshimense]|uniref:RagB/SusD family nutrient uptake outer membrane protein n=1 Tax=Sphingobacterium sp. B16(2022) TaxID=2914044 RepID=UPI001438E1F3|nr:RagB/SusD family nutrient uptake outer membrane protein [Sphingobacterium sp. B16(2022)]NJI73198.1 RagB/SusD family nutrient uptake outer membrane protein [Sphingobacterium sp. B16(2022)]
MKRIIQYILMLNFAFFGISCSNFLDLKPDQKMAVPKTLAHCELLLNDYSAMNTGYPTLGEMANDDYYLNASDWYSVSEYEDQQTYIWAVDKFNLNNQWQIPYKKVYLSNQILDVLSQLDSKQDAQKYNKVIGAAHFFRAFAFHQVAAIFTLPYQESTASQEMGIPLRMSPDMDYKSVRATLQETYEQIISDYKLAIAYLPVSEVLKGRPYKATAYAGLARVYLDLQNYALAYAYADSCLQLQPELLDYKELDQDEGFPFARFNKEVLFPATGQYSSVLSQYMARVDSNLYLTYELHDYRKTLFFQPNDFDFGTYAFKGSYDNSDAQPFVGLTTSEVYLIRAESAVRTGKVTQALLDINMLLRNRIDANHFTPVAENDPDKLLRIILAERRKELIFRGQRWSDLKRLNQDERFKKTLVRVIDGKEYRLEPNSLKYAHLIPELVISESGMPQNKR